MNLDDFVKVDPVREVDRGGSSGDVYRYKYSFGEAHVDELDGELDRVFGSIDAEVDLIDGKLWYKYSGKPEVVVTKDNVYAREGSDRHEATTQAYFVISILESNGFISGINRMDV